MSEPQRKLTPKQLASLMEVSLDTVRRWIRDGVFDYQQIENKKHIRIPYPLEKDGQRIAMTRRNTRK